MKSISMLPNLLTLGNSACGLLAISKGIDALAYRDLAPGMFYLRMESACFLIFLGMVFDALDGMVARLTKSFSDFGAQLDSLSDALTFGVAPALLAKILLEHEGPQLGWLSNPRVHFAAAACFALMAILRLARFNLETEHDQDSHADFRGLPSPAAAGAVTATIWLYLILRSPELERVDGMPTPVGRLMSWMVSVDWHPLLAWMPLILTGMLPLLGFLMVSRVRYVHLTSFLVHDRSTFFTLVALVFGATALYLAPVVFIFIGVHAFVLHGLGRFAVRWLRRRSRRAGRADAGGRPAA